MVHTTLTGQWQGWGASHWYKIFGHEKWDAKCSCHSHAHFSFMGGVQGSGRDFYDHIEMLPHDKKKYGLVKMLLLHGRPLPQVSPHCLSYALISCCSLGVVNTFAIFSPRDTWEVSGTHQRVSHLAPHMLLQQRPAGGDSPAIYHRSDLGLKNRG